MPSENEDQIATFLKENEGKFELIEDRILSAAESNNVEAYISFLRKKFHYLDSKVTIETVRKVCYRLESKETS